MKFYVEYVLSRLIFKPAVFAYDGFMTVIRYSFKLLYTESFNISFHKYEDMLCDYK
jgi:hypothetical protein